MVLDEPEAQILAMLPILAVGADVLHQDPVAAVIERLVHGIPSRSRYPHAVGSPDGLEQVSTFSPHLSPFQKTSSIKHTIPKAKKKATIPRAKAIGIHLIQPPAHH